MKYVYILDENNIVTEIFNAYEDDDIENVINGRTHIIKDEKLNVINYKSEPPTTKVAGFLLHRILHILNMSY